MELKGIRDCLDGKDVLVTGGSGFMGKVLLEKLMRSTNVNRIYIVIRPKRGLSSQARINEMLNLPVFDLVRKGCPERLKILVPLEGELGQENIGLTEPQIKNLQENVAVIFNFAASLKLEDSLKTLVAVNTVATLKLLEMACKFKKLKAFVHLSTAFCHCEEKVLEERLYEPPAVPKHVIDTMSWMDNEAADKITPSLLGPHPNCYTYTKRLAEGLMKEFGPKIPIVIVRPSIVTPAMKEPCKGWVDSLNGPMGVVIAGAKGVLRSMLCCRDNRAEVIPVDVAINGVIVSAWKRCITEIGDGEVLVYNLSAGEVEPVSWGKVLDLGKSIIKDYPLDCGLWYPGGTIRTNPYIHALIVLFCQVIPAYIIDFIFLLARQKRFMVRVQERIRLGLKLLQYFTMRQWIFKINRFMAVFDELSKDEKEIFYTTNINYTIEEYLIDCILGARVFLLKEPLSDLPKARRQLIMMWWIEKIVQAILIIFFGYLLFSYIPIIKVFLDSVIATSQLHTKQTVE